MTGRQRGVQHDTDVLIRQVDARLSRLRAAAGSADAHAADAPDADAAELRLAERLAATLRALAVATASASAADRARVRAAVHYFVLHRDHRDVVPHRDGRWEPIPDRAPRRGPDRSLADHLRVVNQAARELGREDLILPDDAPARPAPARLDPAPGDPDGRPPRVAGTPTVGGRAVPA